MEKKKRESSPKIYKKRRVARRSNKWKKKRRLKASSSVMLGSLSAPEDTSTDSRCKSRTVNPTLSLVKEFLFGNNRLQLASNVPAQEDLHSQSKNDTTISSEIENRPTASKNILELEKFTSDLLEATPPCSDEIMVDNNNLCETEANIVSNILPQGVEHIADKNAQTSEHPTIPSSHKVVVQVENPFVDVEGYKVKNEIMPLVKAIFAKYGDIAKNNTFSMESRSCLLELVCSIYKRLEVSKLMQLTPLELRSMLGQIGALELVNVDVGWLRQQLNQISKARQLVEGVSTSKDVEARTILMIDEKKKTVKTSEKELETCMASVKRLQEKLMQEMEELVDVLSLADDIKNFYEGKLVHGLI
ncbi:hypothetical protein Salat_1575500 [Sesamum alatum]|uniref:Phospholipase-like protein n=1 Tax=Sesamum alatum TaxID=300844 RepID=A0AAE1YD54_9LAMI|nr:hypothetical protein Salat_1575500 [Sesamum alatum]